MTENNQKSDNSPSEPVYQKQEVSFLSVIGSVFAMWFGVQSSKNRERDFAKGDAMPFIVVGVLFVLAMIIGVIIVVKSVLASAGL